MGAGRTIGREGKLGTFLERKFHAAPRREKRQGECGVGKVAGRGRGTHPCTLLYLFTKR